MLKTEAVDTARQICSWKTLQNDERGLFSRWLAEVVRSNPGAVANIAQFSSDEERVLYCSSLRQGDIMENLFPLREAAKKSVFFSGRTTKRGVGKARTTKGKTTFFLALQKSSYDH